MKIFKDYFYIFLCKKNLPLLLSNPIPGDHDLIKLASTLPENLFWPYCFLRRKFLNTIVRLVPNFVEIGPVVLEKMKMRKVYDNDGHRNSKM